ncbi:MAG: membrane protein insertase YidC [Micrococcaceae bacterium]
MQGIYNFFGLLLLPFKYFVAFLLVAWHKIFTVIGMNPAWGVTWCLSIAGLVITLRVILIPILFKQIKAQRQMAVLQPEMMALQKKYKGKNDVASRQAMAQEQQDLFKKHGTTPFASCMPLLFQMPFFLALYHMLMGVQNHETIGPMNTQLVEQFNQATLFGAPLSSTFMTASGSGAMAVKIMAVVMIVVMSGAQFFSQKQLMFKNMSEEALKGPFMQQQKMMMYLFPLMFAIGGFNFPIGMLIYWTINNFWTIGQQYWVIRNNPTPGSQAEKEYHARLRAQGKPIPPRPGSPAAKAAEAEKKGFLQRVSPLSSKKNTQVITEEPTATQGTSKTQVIQTETKTSQPQDLATQLPGKVIPQQAQTTQQPTQRVQPKSKKRAKKKKKGNKK